MHTTVKNAIEANNSTLNGTLSGATSADFQEQFLSFIKSAYPGIHQLKFKKKRRRYMVRGAFGPRALFSWDKNMETAASLFLNEVKRKVVETPLMLDRYYSSLDVV